MSFRRFLSKHFLSSQTTSTPTPTQASRPITTPARQLTQTSKPIMSSTTATTQLSPATKVALITGGSRGLGKNTVLALAKRGVYVIFTYQTNESAANTTIEEAKSIGGPGSLALHLDVAKPETIDEFVKSFISALSSIGKQNFDYLINNAGVGHHGTLAETKSEDIDRIFNIHFKSVFLLTQKLLPHINDGGRIVNTSTGLTRFANPGFILYASMKSAIETYTRYAAKELGKRGITVNVLAPGAIATDFGGGAVRDTKNIRDFIGSQTALGRVGEPDDIGKAYAAVLSDDFSWLSGQRIELSGGQQL
ncbi:hypothetical protein BCR39DRAFT_540561 [Naematelia encephala]|uniref:Short-chain dehydrogenase/reductase SDR n=1 Tax=Naematelia encephala TaxID=71784 RepID=A0A1Y2AXU1_9TREE|nr:hypothetical protein BCR39DRAFT_540561 [Naematelia encephala]